jgi:type I restriction enzyme R subunit
MVRQLRNEESHGSIHISEQEVDAALRIVIDMYLFVTGMNITELEAAGYDAEQRDATIIPLYRYEDVEFEPLMAAEDIFINGSIPVDLPKTKKEELTNGKLDLILMYAIGSGARQKTESAGKIALGIKESLLKDEQLAAYKSLKYLLFHYWKNPQAYALSREPVLVDREAVSSHYLLRMEKDAVKFLLLDYNPMQPADLGNVNILKTQRRGNIRYLPFVTTLDSIIDE